MALPSVSMTPVSGLASISALSARVASLFFGFAGQLAQAGFLGFFDDLHLGFLGQLGGALFGQAHVGFPDDPVHARGGDLFFKNFFLDDGLGDGLIDGFGFLRRGEGVHDAARQGQGHQQDGGDNAIDIGLHDNYLL